MVVQHTDLAYLTGTNQQAHLIVPADGPPLLLVRRVLARARAESPLERIEPLTSLSGLPVALRGAGLEPGSASAWSWTSCPPPPTRGYSARLEGYELGTARGCCEPFGR